MQAIESAYTDDIPFPGSLNLEIRLWCQYWSAESDKPGTVSETLKKVTQDKIDKMYPNIVVILQILLTFAPTSASVERANSILKFIKCALRSTVREDHLNALVLLYIHREIKLDYGQIIDTFATRYPRRILLMNPLLDDIVQ